MGQDIHWRSLDKPELDRALNNGAAVPGSADIVAEWERRSAELRSATGSRLDLPYGPAPRQRIDFLSAGQGAPTLVFIHGGYWQMRSKETFTFVSAGPLARGVSVAHVGYTLAPDATLDDMAKEIWRALDWLAGELKSFGGDPERVWISGWSAGGHLAAMSLGHPIVQGGLAISGLYDLEPIRHSYVNDKLRLDAAAAVRNSPAKQPLVDKPIALVVGGAELPLMRQQSADFHRLRAQSGMPGWFEEFAGYDHFSILEELASPEGRLTSQVIRLMTL